MGNTSFTDTKTFASYKNAKLDLEEKVLRVEKTLSTYLVRYRYTPEGEPKISSKCPIKSEFQGEKVFQLQEVTPEVLRCLRQKKVPSFVLKIEGKYYWCKIPKNLSFFSNTLFGKHMCATGSRMCARLAARQDIFGGCQKIRDSAYGAIEKYPWITQGYESFSTNYNCFVVVQCEHFK